MCIHYCYQIPWKIKIESQKICPIVIRKLAIFSSGLIFRELLFLISFQCIYNFRIFYEERNYIVDLEITLISKIFKQHFLESVQQENSKTSTILQQMPLITLFWPTLYLRIFISIFSKVKPFLTSEQTIAARSHGISFLLLHISDTNISDNKN